VWTARTVRESLHRQTGNRGHVVSDWIKPLSDEELAARDAALEMAAQLVGSELPLDADQVQALYDALLQADVLGDSELAIAGGMAFGDLFVAGGIFEWVRVSDEYGEETCVAYRGKSIFLSPISMIQKRLNRQEQLSIAALRDDTAHTIETRIAEGQAADR
jgi:hypothetical protein